MSRQPLDWKQDRRRSNAIRRHRLAGDEISYDGHRVYANGLLVYDPENEAVEAADAASSANEEATKLWMYGEALTELAQEHWKYRSNANMWRRWDDRQRLWWIAHAEHQAQQGMQTIGVEVVARAVTIRLTRSRT